MIQRRKAYALNNIAEIEKHISEHIKGQRRLDSSVCKYK